MPDRKVPENYQVAFSLAGEQREIVLLSPRQLRLRKSLVRGPFFFDEWFEFFLAGNDADLKLQKIYSRQAELVVVYVSGRYGDKPWTRCEHEAIRARQMVVRESKDECDQHRILPIRVGEGAEVQRKWLLKLRTEKGLAQAVNLAGPFIMNSQGNRSIQKGVSQFD